jgi:hypothetical protein
MASNMILHLPSSYHTQSERSIFRENDLTRDDNIAFYLNRRKLSQSAAALCISSSDDFSSFFRAFLQK